MMCPHGRVCLLQVDDGERHKIVKDNLKLSGHSAYEKRKNNEKRGE